MKKQFLNRAVALAIMTVGLAAAGNAHAASALTIGKVSLYAGPGIHYPVVGHAGARTTLTVAGCVKGLSWCNVEKDDGTFGWTRGARLTVASGKRQVALAAAPRAARPQIVPYDINSYWDEHYTSADFYKNRTHYGYNPHSDNRPPLDQVNGDEGAVSVSHQVPHMIDDKFYSK